MNKEMKQLNTEEENVLDEQVISKFKELRKEIKAPYASFLQAMKMLEEPALSPILEPTKSPFYIPMFFRISVPALVVMMIVGFSVKNTIETKNDSAFMPINEIANEEVTLDSLAMIQAENSNEAQMPPSADTSTMMTKSAPTESSTNTADNNNEELENIINQEYSTYSNSDDTKYASYDEAQMTNFVNFYGQNF